MLINYFEEEPNTYVLSHRNGKLIRHCTGINYFYVAQQNTEPAHAGQDRGERPFRKRDHRDPVHRAR